MPHPATIPPDELFKQCAWSHTRASGPGGQHRNKVQTGAVLLHTPTGISAQATERRSQEDNRRVALKRLRLNLAINHRTPVPVPKGLDEIASELWRSRRQGDKIICNPKHHDYPALLAELFDVAADSKWDSKKTALRLGVTMSQLLKLARNHPPALTYWNRNRAEHNLNPLK